MQPEFTVYVVLALVMVVVGMVAVVLWQWSGALKRKSSRGDEAAPRPESHRRLPVLIECATCAHFDLEEGQAYMRQYPAFLGAASVRSPAQMSSKALLDVHGNVTGWQGTGPDGKVTPLKAKWADFGACAVHQEGRYRHDVCSSYERDGTKIEALNTLEAG